MQIGTHVLRNRLFVAPMAGVTDRPFRQLCRRFGAGLAVSEMITSKPELRASEKTRRRMDHAGEVAPISVQIAGSDPAMMADAARFNVEHGAQIIDVNMGCPAKKVCNVAAGSALLRDEALVARILEAVVNAVPVPVTLKFRTGWSRERKNALAIARIAEDAGIRLLALHGRTRECGYVGAVEYDTIAEVKAATRLPVIANGDIDSPERARAVLEYTGADGVMIGRAAQGRPWIFREIEHYLATGRRLPPPGVAEIREVITEHVAQLHAFYGRETGVRVARKHIGWTMRSLDGSAGAERFRQHVNTLEDCDAQLDAVRAYFDNLAQHQDRLRYAEEAIAA
jgi:tRNA-dihydrouridine synthase B